MNGIVVVGANNANAIPSHYFAGHFSFVGEPLLSTAKHFIDGLRVTLPSSVEPSVDVMPVEVNPAYARLTILDTSFGVERAFVVTLRARTGAEIASTPNNRDPAGRGMPTLLADLQPSPTTWQVYNCHVDFTVWPRSNIYAGKYPRP